jgi:hypothetical protein
LNNEKSRSSLQTVVEVDQSTWPREDRGEENSMIQGREGRRGREEGGREEGGRREYLDQKSLYLG